MASRVITIPEPTETTRGLIITIERDATQFIIVVHYQGATARIKAEDLTATQRTTLSNFVQAILTRSLAALGH